MGWSGGTQVFDAAVDAFIEVMTQAAVDNDDDYWITKFIIEFYNSDAFLYSDWDTQDESKYFNPYLLEIMADNGEIEQIDYEWYKDNLN